MSTKPHRRTSTPAGAARRGQGRTSSRSTELQRRIQRRVARSDRQHPAKEFDGSMQADACAYPEPPLPAQHKAKPGHESQIDPPPMYDAPYYHGSGKLQRIILRYVPDVRSRWRDVAVGAVVTAFLFTVGKALLGV